MNDTSATVEKIEISPKTFHEIEDLRRRVDVTLSALNEANEEKKSAQKAYDASRDAHEKAVARMIREINGEPEFPLFANQSDAIAAAQADPIAQKLLSRLIDHGVTHLNQLVIAGYNEGERNEVARYLDALDARQAAVVEGEAEQLDLEVPAFLVPDPPAEVSGIQRETFIRRLGVQGVELKPEHIDALSAAQWIEAEAWMDDCDRIKHEKGEALVVDDLPSVPLFLVHPAEPEPEPAVKTKKTKKTKKGRK